MSKKPGASVEGRLEGGEHLRSAGMADEAIDIGYPKPGAVEDGGDGRLDVFLREGRQGLLEDDAEAWCRRSSIP